MPETRICRVPAGMLCTTAGAPPELVSWHEREFGCEPGHDRFWLCLWNMRLFEGDSCSVVGTPKHAGCGWVQVKGGPVQFLNRANSIMAESSGT